MITGMETKKKVVKAALFYVLFILVAIYALVKIIDIQYFDKHEQVAFDTKQETLECLRGGILSDDGRYFAFSVPRYMLYMDCVQPVDTAYSAGIDSLAKCLSALYGDKPDSHYKNLIETGRKQGKRYLKINSDRTINLLTYQQMKLASTFPIFKKGRNFGGVIFETIDYREYPYGKLAFRTLGYIKGSEDLPKIGIEGGCDSILRGTKGTQFLRKTEHNEWIPDVETQTIYPIDGMDVQTTISVDIQHIAEKALLSKLTENEHLQAGCVIVMEVATGEIKAMVNMEKNEKGGFSETYNYAIGTRGNPGSVFKLATLTNLLNDKKVTLHTTMKAVEKWYYKNGKKPFEDHYLKNYDTISVLRGFEISSNNVFRMLAANYYDSDPDAFFQKYRDLKYCYTFPFELNGFQKDTLPSTKSKYYSYTDLPQVAMGYVVEVTPLHTANYYNAIANNGVMVKPHLVKNYQKNGVESKIFKPEVLTKVCSPDVAKELQKAMRGVVVNGTGKSVFSNCKVAIAGKTGTAQILNPDNNRYVTIINGKEYKKHQATFAGFFPYESPKYTVIAVVYSTLSTQNFYGATWAAPIVREIAEELYFASPSWGVPVRENGTLPDTSQEINRIINDTIQGVPNLIGMGLKDGLYLLEHKGYKVTFSGKGTIVDQYPQPGSVTDNKSIVLTLSENHGYETE